MKKAITRLYALALMAFTAFVLLDVFVFTQVGEAPVVGNVTFPTQTQPLTTEPSREMEEPWDYADDNLRIRLESLHHAGTNVYVARVQLRSAELLRTAFAQNTYGKNITAPTSQTAEEVDAIFAVNGDYYGSRRDGFVLRNGNLYRDVASDREALVIWPDGSLEAVRETDVSAHSLLEQGAWQVLSFGPCLVRNGQVDIHPQYETGKAAAANPRTAIGMIAPLDYVFVVTDGRSGDSSGLTVRQLAQLMQGYGVQFAYNLDGGGSSSMVFMGQLINDPGTSKKSEERSVSDIVYIGY